jgi:hypothetical protein
MKRIARAAIFGLGMVWLAGQSGPIRAQDIANSQVEIAYVAPTNPEFVPLYERLKIRQPLEELRQFLAPLQLPRKLLVKTDQCGATYVPYDFGPATICYEYLDQIERLAPADVSPSGVTRANAIAGAFVQVALHQVAEALYNILQAPVWGRQEDAADKLAGFIMMQFGKDVALRTLTGTTYFYEASDRTWTGVDFSDERGTEDQRFYNYLCIAYGGDPATFGNLVQDHTLPKSRADGCYHEYTELQFAFRQTILPHVDQELMAKVQSMQWLRPDDGQFIASAQAATAQATAATSEQGATAQAATAQAPASSSQPDSVNASRP